MSEIPGFEGVQVRPCSACRSDAECTYTSAGWLCVEHVSCRRRLINQTGDLERSFYPERRVYSVVYEWHEDYAPTLLIGPEGRTQAGFKALCDRLVPQAARLAVAKDDADFPCWIGWRAVADSLVDILVEHYGFRHLEPKEAKYFGSNLIEPDNEAEDDVLIGGALAEVHAHNARVAARSASWEEK